MKIINIRMNINKNTVDNKWGLGSMKEILVKEILGTNVNLEDAIILREMMNIHLENNIVLDFKDIKDIPVAFFSSLLTETICKKGREYVSEHLVVQNVPNVQAFKRVLLGTSCC